MEVEWKRMKWKNIIVEVADEEDIKFMDEIINDLVIPFNVIESAAAMFVSCRKEIFVDAAGLRIPIVLRDECSTSGCSTWVYISLPIDHPLRPLLRKAVEQTWIETVKSLKIIFYGEVFVKHVEFNENTELETIYVECDDGEKTVIQVPLKTLKEKLEKALESKEKVLEIIRDTEKLVEEVEKQLSSLDVDVDTEFLRRRLRRSYLSVLKPRDELDVEF